MKQIDHIDGDPMNNNLLNLRLVDKPSAASVAATAIADAKAEAAVAVADAVGVLAEGSRRAFEVAGACGPEVIGVGRHARLLRLAALVALELRQIESLP